MEIHPAGFILVRIAHWFIIRLMCRYPRFRELVSQYRHHFRISFKGIFLLMFLLIVTALVFREYAIYPALLILSGWFFAAIVVQTLEFLESQERNKS
jgi:hypothetical protein